MLIMSWLIDFHEVVTVAEGEKMLGVLRRTENPLTVWVVTDNSKTLRKGAAVSLPALSCLPSFFIPLQDPKRLMALVHC